MARDDFIASHAVIESNGEFSGTSADSCLDIATSMDGWIPRGEYSAFVSLSKRLMKYSENGAYGL